MGTEHLLLGLMSVPDSAAGGILVRLGLDPERIGSEVGLWFDRVDFGPPNPESARFSPRARAALEAGLKEAKAGGSDSPGSQHLLLALLEDPAGVAAELLRRHSVTPEQFRAELPL